MAGRPGETPCLPYRFEPLAEPHGRGVIDIFNHYIREGFAAYPEEPLESAFFKRFLEMTRGYPALAAVDESGGVAGFAFLRPWHHATTFRRTAEITYFLAPEHTRRGLGSALLAHLLDKAPALGVDRILASISSRNAESLAFHRRHGFVECGRFPAVGRKHGQDFDVVWMIRAL